METERIVDGLIGTIPLMYIFSGFAYLMTILWFGGALGFFLILFVYILQSSAWLYKRYKKVQ